MRVTTPIGPDEYIGLPYGLVCLHLVTPYDI